MILAQHGRIRYENNPYRWPHAFDGLGDRPSICFHEQVLVENDGIHVVLNAQTNRVVGRISRIDMVTVAAE
jgi:hypothetical protein